MRCVGDIDDDLSMISRCVGDIDDALSMISKSVCSFDTSDDYVVRTRSVVDVSW